MSVNSITSAFAGYAQRLTGGGSTSAAALQEATETHAQTLKEAHNGDRVAMKRLQHQRQQQEESQPSAADPGKGVQVDQKA